MKIEIIVDPARPPTLSQRVAPAPTMAATGAPAAGAATNGTRRLVAILHGRFRWRLPL